MTLWALHCIDGEHGARLREIHLQAHLEHVKAHIARYAVAGPLKQGGRTVGSLLVIRADDEASARAFFETDPYFGVGVWQAIRCEEFRAVAGEWAGGVAWE